MRWVLGVFHFLSFITLWFGASTFIRATFAIPRTPTDSDLLIGIGWIGVAIFLQLAALGITVESRHADSAD
jgi:hypothetical protein